MPHRSCSGLATSFPGASSTAALEVVAALAVELGRTGAAGVPRALDTLVAQTGLAGAVLRGPASDGAPGPVLATGEPSFHGPDVETAGMVVELPVHRPGVPAVPLAVLSVAGASPGLLPALRAAAALLGLALTAASSCGGAAPCDALDAVEHDRGRIADRLHDVALQDLLVARLAADAAVRGAPAEAARDAVQHALVGLRRLLWHVRPRQEQDLAAALTALSDRLVEAGGLPLAVLGVLPPAGLDPVVGTTAFRVVQAVAFDAAPGDRAVTVALRPDPSTPGALVLDVDGGAELSEPDRWRTRLRAHGGDLVRIPGRLRVLLPLRPTSDADPPPVSGPAPVLDVLVPASLTALPSIPKALP